METKYFMIKVLCCLLFVFQLQAEETTEESKDADGAPTATVNKELTEVEKQVASLSAKIKAKNDSIKDLLKQKSVERDSEKLSEIIKLVQQEHRDLEKTTREYNAQLGILQYRFPERGLSLGRRYQRLNTKSLDDMEKTLGLEAHLKKSREKAKTVYGVKDKPAVRKDKSMKKDATAEENLLQPAVLSK